MMTNVHENKGALLLE